MAILADINTSLVTQINAALAAASISGYSVGTEWPPKDALQSVGNSSSSKLSIIHKLTNYQCKNMRFPHSTQTEPVGIQSTLSDVSFAPGHTVDLTIGYATGSSAVNTNDMLSLLLTNGDSYDGATFSAPSGATLSSVATGLAAAIETVFPGITAIATGAVIAITNGTSVGYNVASNVGNVTNVAETVNWAIRNMQLNVWTGNLIQKFAIQQAMEQLFATIDDAQGFFLDSGEWIRLKFHGARPDDAEVDKDVFCDMYLFTIENMVDIPVEMWAVIAPNPALTQADSITH